MKIVKPDWTLYREAEEQGLVAAMTPIVLSPRTKLNEELSHYFRETFPYMPLSFDEEESEDILSEINAYLKEKQVNRRSIDFPLSSGTDVHLIPATDNLQLKLLVVDEYQGSGEYSKYVDMSYFVMNNYTTKEDVNVLIDMVKRFANIK